jgi:hypothetical protein
MKKSKQILDKTFKIIIMTIGIIFFLESDFFIPLRTFISKYIIFFQGKGALISNICLGILGSAILTFISEHSEYKSVKSKLEGDILSVYKKWEYEIEPQTLEQINDVKYVELIGEYMYPYWGEISSLYNTYVPYNRNKNIYVKLIKALYDYIKNFIVYVDAKQSYEKTKEYLTRTLKDWTELKNTVNSPEQIEIIDRSMAKVQGLLNNLEDPSKKENSFFDLINRNRCSLNEVAPQAELLNLLYYKSEVENQDFKQEMSDIKNMMAKQRRMRYFYNVKNFFRSIYWKFKLRHCKKYFIDP